MSDNPEWWDDVTMDEEDLSVFIDSLKEELRILYNIDGAGDVEELCKLREMVY
jgi:hypothetical protein